jgi:RimJ/RimL family protein N-acetyltransferase
MTLFVRPDGRRFLRGEPDDLPSGEIYATVAESDVARYEHAGFAVNRREDEYLVPTAQHDAEPPAGYGFRRADEADEQQLRLLDDALRQDVPGTEGWRWEPADFRAETFETTAFDPATYLVALEESSGRYVGLIRVWMKVPTPRLGMIGVVPSHRGRGLASALMRAVLRELHQRGVAEVTTEVDVANAASQALLAGFGAHRVGGHVELVRRC